MNNQPLVTVIIPIYNVEKYLRKCLDSILEQTLMNHKAILVDDGSMDQSGAIAQEYAEKHPDMFTYLYQENAGQGAARNRALKQADTRYILFLDSDDWLMPRTIENITKAIDQEEEAPDIAFMNPVVYDMATKGYSEWSDTGLLNRLFENEHILSPRTTPEMYALEASLCRCAWRTGFLRMHHFTFPEGVKWEDVFPHFFLFYWARRCIKIDDAGFYYRINSGNQTTSAAGRKRLDVIPVYAYTLKYAIENNWQKVEIAYILHMMQLFAVWSVDVARKDVRRELVKELHSLYQKIPRTYYRAYLKELKPGLKMRIFWNVIRMPVGYVLLSNHNMIDFGKRAYGKLKAIGGRILR